MRRRQGSSAIEFALVTMVLCLLGVGGVEYGWFFFQVNRVENVVVAASRVAAGTLIEDDPAAVFEEELELRMARLDLDASYVSAEVVGGGSERVLVVEVEFPFKGLSGLVPTPDTVRIENSTWLEDQSRSVDDDELV